MNKNFVYIYYSSNNYSEATKVCIFLESKGINCWLAPRNVLSSLDYNTQVTAAINDCSIALFIANNNTNDINTLPNELNTVATKKKTIIFFKIENYDISDVLSYYFSELKSINAYDNFDLGLNSLYNEVSLSINDKTSTNETFSSNPDPIILTEEDVKEEKINNNTSNNNQKEEKNTNNQNKKTDDKDYIFCTHCGAKMPISFPICTNCGKSLKGESNSDYDFTSTKPDLKVFRIITFVLMILSTIAYASLIVPLIWCIPMTVAYWDMIQKNKKPSMTFKICTLIFVGIIPGILMLCEDQIKQ